VVIWVRQVVLLRKGIGATVLVVFCCGAREMVLKIYQNVDIYLHKCFTYFFNFHNILKNVHISASSCDIN